MTEWVPFFQSLLWPILVAIVLWFTWDDLKRLIGAIVNRIELGDSIEAGTSGIKLVSSHQSQIASHGVLATDASHESRLPNEFYLVHTAKRDRRLDKGDLEYYRLRIWIEADEPGLMNDVASVTYYLHPTFQEPVRIVTDRTNNFSISTSAWGQFNMYAEIKFKSKRSTIDIERYINF